MLLLHGRPAKQLTVTRVVFFHEKFGLPCIWQKGELITATEKYSVMHTLYVNCIIHSYLKWSNTNRLRKFPEGSF